MKIQNQSSPPSERPCQSHEKIRPLICGLHKIGAVKFGNFTLKNGRPSPIYIDLRLIISFPDLLKAVAKAIWSTIEILPCDLVCGVPYTALPIATAISLETGIPMVMRRKEIKDYGTKKAIEGCFDKNQECIVIEDLITSGSSILETCRPLKKEGLHVRHAAVLIDRQQGGEQSLSAEGISLHSLFTLSEALTILRRAEAITGRQARDVETFLKNERDLLTNFMVRY